MTLKKRNTAKMREIITDRFFTPSEWDISPVEHWQAFADETRRADP